MDEVSVLLCSFCDFRCYDDKSLLKHIRDIHENDPNFVVYCSQCGRSYKKWSSLKKHLHREHPSAYIFTHILCKLCSDMDILNDILNIVLF